MFNDLFLLTLKWYSLFLSMDLNLVFVFIFTFYVVCICASASFLNLFFNIFLFLIATIFFIFIQYSGAYAGFLFLCETTSLFAIYIVLNKVHSDKVFIHNYSNSKLKLLIVISPFLLYFIYNLFYYLFFDSIWHYYTDEILNYNDFIASAYLYYSDTYNSFTLISFFLIIFSALIIVSVNNQLTDRLCKGKFSIQNFWGIFIKQTFQENNIISFKNKITINFFKKLC